MTTCLRCGKEFEPVDQSFEECDPCMVQMALDKKRHGEWKQKVDFQSEASGEY